VFDLRYHVVSLAAVFLALVIGILLGVGISETGRVDKVERDSYEARISDLEDQLESARAADVASAREQRAAEEIVDRAYPALMNARLDGMRVARVYVGPEGDGKVSSGIDSLLADAGASSSRYLRALKVPIDPDAVMGALDGRAELARYVGPDRFDELGSALADELLGDGDTPLWDALSQQLVLNEEGSARRPPDAVIIGRTVEPQQGETAALLAGFYKRLASSGIPVVAVEASDTRPSGVPAYRRNGLSTVDAVDTKIGRLAAALVLGGAQAGSYGIKATADRLLPREIEPVPPATTAAGG
jgi:Copper transport outer membrane protein, MctB